jgi:hypothetical protein
MTNFQRQVGNKKRDVALSSERSDLLQSFLGCTKFVRYAPEPPGWRDRAERLQKLLQVP